VIDGDEYWTLADDDRINESYIRERCGACREPNFVYLGDLSDLTRWDVDYFVCWSCGAKTIMTNDELIIEGYIAGESMMEEKGTASAT